MLGGDAVVKSSVVTRWSGFDPSALEVLHVTIAKRLDSDPLLEQWEKEELQEFQDELSAILHPEPPTPEERAAAFVTRWAGFLLSDGGVRVAIAQEIRAAVEAAKDGTS